MLIRTFPPKKNASKYQKSEVRVIKYLHTKKINKYIEERKKITKESCLGREGSQPSITCKQFGKCVLES